MAPPVAYNSRYNTSLRFYFTTMASVLVGLGVTIGGFADPALTFLNNPAINAATSGFIGTLTGLGVVGLFNSRLAKSTSTVDQAYQEAVIWPHPQEDAGYLVLQPHHRKAGWRLRDTIDWRKPPKVLGWVDTVDQAHALCQAVTQDSGVVVDPHQWSSPQRHAFMRAYAKYRQTPALYQTQAQSQLTGLWRVTALDATHPGVLAAYRTRYTAHGRQWEFYPPPPQHAATLSALFQGLQRHNLLSSADHALPDPLPEGSPLSQAPELQTAWTVQRLGAQATVPWTLLNIAPPNRIPSWTAGCATPNPTGDGMTWHFYPSPPRTLSDPQQLMHDLRRYSAPDQTPQDWPVTVTPPADAVAQWQTQTRPRAPLSPASLSLVPRSRQRSI